VAHSNYLGKLGKVLVRLTLRYIIVVTPTFSTKPHHGLQISLSVLC
jgi:hypothetical protein